MKTRTNYVWVVELLDHGKWLPCIECRLTRQDARVVLAQSQKAFPSFKLRIRRYEAVR
jgi:hypothetical protein